MYSDYRTFNDMKNWDPLIGRTFYELHPKDKTQYRTVRVAWNAFSNSKYGQYSNFVTGHHPWTSTHKSITHFPTQQSSS